MGLLKNDCWLRALGVGLVATCAVAGAGCQNGNGPAGFGQQMKEYQESADRSGLMPVQTMAPVKVSCAPPEKWTKLPARETAFYTHQQWRSPTKSSGVGAIYIHMLLPLSTKALLWMAKSEYNKKQTGGRIIGEWTDSLGRHWFEGENNKYHAKGYAITRGLDGWIVYSGYKLATPPDAKEKELAAKCLDTIVPQMSKPAAPTTQTVQR